MELSRGKADTIAPLCGFVAQWEAAASYPSAFTQALHLL